MHNPVNKGLILVTSLFVTGLLIGIFINLFTIVKNAVYDNLRFSENTANSMVYDKFETYDGKEVYGDTVYIAGASFNSEEFCIAIRKGTETFSIGNKLNSSTENLNGTYSVDLSKLKYENGYYEASYVIGEKSKANYFIFKETGDTYINYRKKYMAELIRDSSYTIIGIMFTER